MLGHRVVRGERQLQHPRRVVERCLGRCALLDDVQKMGYLAGKGLWQVIRESHELCWLRPAMELVHQPGLAAGHAAVPGGHLEMPAADRAECPAGDDLADDAGGEANEEHPGVL